MDREKISYLADKLYEWGATKYGFSFVGDVLPDNLKHLKYAISVVVRLSDQIINDIKNGPTYTYFSHYRAVNFLIDQITLRAVLLLQDWGFLSMAIPASQTVKGENVDEYSGLFQHKTAATKAGLGWIGKNGLLITPEYGPRVRLGTVLTEMELPTGTPFEEGKCGECRACVTSCPAFALHGTNWKKGLLRKEILDAKSCSEYMNQHFKHVGRGSVCGICINVCPVGDKILR